MRAQARKAILCLGVRCGYSEAANERITTLVSAMRPSTVGGGRAAPRAQQDFQAYSTLQTTEGLGLSEGSATRSGFLPDVPRTAAGRMQGVQKTSPIRPGAASIVAPQIDLPQRVGAPPTLNAPRRRQLPSRDVQIRASFNSEQTNKVSSLRKSKYDIKSYGAAGRRAAGLNLKQRTKNNNSSLQKLKDLSMLAYACRRAGRLVMEGQAYFSMAVLNDNLDAWTKAIENYKKFLDVCRRCDDVAGEALACNCIGVDYYNLAMGSAASAGLTVGLGAVTVDARKMEQAIHFHERHLELADDPGKFVAQCNLGLAFSKLGEHTRAAQLHQDALRLAIKQVLQSAHGQSIAVGNLGLIGSKQGDLATAKACMDKHLHLARDLQNWPAERKGLACQQLGQIANAQGNYQQASQYYEEARRIALSTGEQGMLKLVNCDIGVTHGNLRMENHMRHLSDSMKK